MTANLCCRQHNYPTSAHSPPPRLATIGSASDNIHLLKRIVTRHRQTYSEIKRRTFLGPSYLIFWPTPEAGIGLDGADFLLARIENVNLITTGDVNLIFQGGRNEKQ